MTRFTAAFSLQLVLCLATLGGVAKPVNGEEVGTVAAVDGSAEVGRGGVWVSASPGAAVAVGDHLRTGQPGRMRVVFRDDSVLVLADSTTVVVDEQVFDPAASQSVFELLSGKLRSVASHYYGAAGAKYEVQTSTAVAGVRGTEFVVTYDPATGATEVVAISGVVAVHSAVDPAGPGLLVTANEATGVAAGELPSAARRVDPESMRELLNEMEFFGSSQSLSLTDTSSVIAGMTVPQPARAPAGAGDVGADLLGGPTGSAFGVDAPTALGNSPAAVIGGGSGSINVQPGRRP
jgi:hypothetical protein